MATLAYRSICADVHEASSLLWGIGCIRNPKSTQVSLTMLESLARDIGTTLQEQVKSLETTLSQILTVALGIGMGDTGNLVETNDEDISHVVWDRCPKPTFKPEIIPLSHLVIEGAIWIKQRSKSLDWKIHFGEKNLKSTLNASTLLATQQYLHQIWLWDNQMRMAKQRRRGQASW
uniref:Uncharacterized protein n=1 Tax=Oryza brachyantha TaxID=4533 RepID=J3LXW2_ORYBR